MRLLLVSLKVMMLVLRNKRCISVSTASWWLASPYYSNSNNFCRSKVDNACMEFADELFEAVGRDNLVLHTVDLTSDDGLKDYEAVDRYVSLITADQYRKWVEILDQHKPDGWWWLATPHSTARHESDRWVKCVAPAGDIFNGFCSDDHQRRAPVLYF